jgi:hypothetical protein
MIPGHQKNGDAYLAQHAAQVLILGDGTLIHQIPAEHQQVGNPVQRPQMLDTSNQARHGIDAVTVAPSWRSDMQIGELGNDYGLVNPSRNHSGTEFCFSVT